MQQADQSVVGSLKTKPFVARNYLTMKKPSLPINMEIQKRKSVSLTFWMSTNQQDMSSLKKQLKQKQKNSIDMLMVVNGKVFVGDVVMVMGIWIYEKWWWAKPITIDPRKYISWTIYSNQSVSWDRFLASRKHISIFSCTHIACTYVVWLKFKCTRTFCNFLLLHFRNLHTHHIFASVCQFHFATHNLIVVTEEEALKANPKTTIKLLNYDVITEFLTGLNWWTRTMMALSLWLN